MKNPRYSILAAMALTFACAGAAMAADRDNTVRVSYADLNIASVAGSHTLLARIEAASRQACAPKPDIRDLADNQRYRTCMKEGVRRAVAAVNLPQLNLAYENSQGKSARGASVAQIEREPALSR